MRRIGPGTSKWIKWRGRKMMMMIHHCGIGMIWLLCKSFIFRPLVDVRGFLGIVWSGCSIVGFVVVVVVATLILAFTIITGRCSTILNHILSSPLGRKGSDMSTPSRFGSGGDGGWIVVIIIIVVVSSSSSSIIWCMLLLETAPRRNTMIVFIG